MVGGISSQWVVDHSGYDVRYTRGQVSILYTYAPTDTLVKAISNPLADALRADLRVEQVCLSHAERFSTYLFARRNEVLCLEHITPLDVDRMLHTTEGGCLRLSKC